MAEPQPPNVHEGPDDPPAPVNAEDRKAAAALSSLDARGDDDDSSRPNQGKDVDAEALGKAMQNLDGSEARGGDGKGKAVKGKEEGGKKGEGVKRVRVEGADVALLVEQLEVPKARATELLRAHEGDAVRAMGAYVTPAGSLS